MDNNIMQSVILHIVAYYRMSSDDQTASIEQQQKEVRRYAQQRGWVIVREYIDEGKSGSKSPELRTAFHKMIADSAAGDFTLVSTLKNPVYCGDVAFGMRRAQDGKGAFASATPQVRRDACPAIVDRELWQRVQDKLKSRATPGKRLRTGKREYPLSGLLLCEHCGHRMTGCSDGPRTYYTCLSPQNRPYLGCKNWKVREDKIFPLVCREVARAVDFELLRAIEARPKPRDGADVKRLRDEVAALKRKISRGAENLLLVFHAMQKSLLKWKDELAKAENTLSLALAKVNRSKVEEWAEWWQSVRGRLVTVAEIVWGNRHWQSVPILPDKSLSAALKGKIGKCKVGGRLFEVEAGGDVFELIEMEGPVRPAVLAEADTARELLKRLNLSVVLSWQPNGKRYYTLTRAVLRAEFGEVALDPDGEVVTCQLMNTSAPPVATRSNGFSPSRPTRLRSARSAASRR